MTQTTVRDGSPSLAPIAAGTQKPVGITLEAEVALGASYEHHAAEWATYEEWAAAYSSYEEASIHVPEEGTTP